MNTLIMDSNNQDFFKALLKDVSFTNWAKGINKNDIAYWNAWISANPKYIESIETAKAIVLGITFEPIVTSEEKINKELGRVLNTIQLSEEANKKKNIFQNRRKFISLASAAVVLFLLSWTSFNFYQSSNTTIHKTNFGEIIDLKLPDGTSVVLNGNSEIRYEKENPRDIYLKGEAYFKVKPMPSTNAKFWVHTNDLKVEVLGTQFHVITRTKKTKVVLDEGSIHLEFNNGEVKKMIPGELVTFSKELEKVEYKKVSVATPYSLWRDGTYTFNEISLKEVMRNIEYTYGITVNYATPDLENLLITGGVPNQNLKICISAIEKATGTRIVLKENTLLIQKEFNN